MPAFEARALQITKIEFVNGGPANVTFQDLPSPGQTLVVTGLSHANGAALAALTTDINRLTRISFETLPAVIIPPDPFYTAPLRRTLTIEV